MTPREENDLVTHFEAFVKTTARMMAKGEHPTMVGMPPLEVEEEDVAQLLRMKVLYGIRKFDETRSKRAASRGRTPLEKWIFSVVFDCCKDIAKKRRRFDVMLEDLTWDHNVNGGGGTDKELVNNGRVDFERRHLTIDENDAADLPAHHLESLTEREREVATMLYEGFSQTEIMSLLGLAKREMEALMRSLRLNLSYLRGDSQPATLGG